MLPPWACRLVLKCPGQGRTKNLFECERCGYQCTSFWTSLRRSTFADPCIAAEPIALQEAANLSKDERLDLLRASIDEGVASNRERREQRCRTKARLGGHARRLRNRQY